ncbi:MAG: H(+)/Cl(-) exchange transporter ClcA [Kiritimatiellales bacterium]
MKLFKRKESPEDPSELHHYLTSRQQRHWIFPRAALVGLFAGLVALAFRVALAEADTFRSKLIDWSHQRPAWGWILPILFTAFGAWMSTMLVRNIAPEASGSGIPHLEAVLQRFRKLDWKRILPVKFIGGILAIGGGLTLGREGPTVQMGGAIGDAVARFLKVPARERLIMISSGAGAGLAAAFNAPMAGLIFVLEEVRRDFQPVVFGAAFLAAVISDIIARIGTGQFPIFTVPGYVTPPLTSLPVFALLGILAGFLGVLFNRGLMKTVQLYSQIPHRLILPAAALTGAAVGLIGWFSPTLIGSGHGLAEEALKGRVVLSAIPLLFLARFLMTSTCYATGAPGGIFAPLLVLGALLGLAVGQIAHMLVPSAAPVPAVFAVVGMAAYFSAIVRAPLTGVMLILEMTGNYSQMLPLLISCFCAYIVGEALKDTPIYEALLERDLKRSPDVVLLPEPTVTEFIVAEGAPFAGRDVRSLGLPSGCILIRCAEDNREWVPGANTRLKPHMRITAVIGPEAFGGLELLRMGCSAP